MGTDLFVIFLCLVLSAFFSGIEIAFISASRLKLELDRKQGRLAARMLERPMNNRSKFIGAMLLGNNVALVVYGILMARLLEPLILQFITSHVALLVIQTIISTLIILVMAEFLPKALFRVNPNRALSIFAFPVAFFYYALYAFVTVTIGLAEAMLRALFRMGSSVEETALARVDLEHYLSRASENTASAQEVGHEVQILKNALDFSNVKARECMVPRTEIVAVDASMPLEELRQRFIRTGLSKILVYDASVDNIIGYVHSYELFKKPDGIKSVLLPISIVPESMPARELLELFISSKRSVAVVVDEFGGTSGLVTMEDIIEEIFGEIEDEHDKDSLVELPLSENEFEFSARLEIDYLNEKYKLELPESEEYETLAGLILQHCESIPRVNENIEIEGFKLIILQVDDNRIERVKLRKAGD